MGRAAVLALVFLFVLGAVGLMVVTVVHGAMALGDVFALACFVLLASGIVAGLMKMAEHWDEGGQAARVGGSGPAQVLRRTPSARVLR